MMPERRSRCRLFIVYMTVALFCAGLFRPARAWAQPALPTCSAAALEDRDGDGSADVARLDCDFGADAPVQLTMYCPVGGLTEEAIAEQLLNPGDCTWVFDSGADGTANLIIRFHKEGETFVADLYDDRDEDGQVSHTVTGAQVDVTESDFWTVQVISDTPWYANGRFNFNLTLFVDGYVEVHFGTEKYESLLAHDGTPDFQIQVADRTGDGRPDHDLRQLLIPRAWEFIGQVFQLMVNWRDGDAPPEGADLWPFLATAIEATGTRVVKGGTSFAPPIQIDWTRSRIVAISEFVASRFNESGCFIYGSDRLQAHGVIEAAFENPFCFYDLAEDGDETPELSIRSEYWPANHWGFIGGRFDSPIQWLRYSWDQNNDGGWDYGVGLAGRHKYDESINIGDYLIRSISYDRFPTWSTGQVWDEAIFIDVVDHNYGSSEGIYEAQVPVPILEQYLTGLADTPPPTDPESFLIDGLRIEYAADLVSQVQLYYSPVDGHLHLSGATSGFWKKDDKTQLEYGNNNGDQFIDEWRYMAQGKLRERLNWTPDYLVLADSVEQSITLKQTTTPAALFETPIPATHAEWVSLGRMLEDHSLLAVETLGEMMSQFEGPEMRLTGAELAAFRLLPEGYRLQLTLKPDFRITGPDLVTLSGLAPGEYVVEHRNGMFSVIPLTPPQLALAARQPDLSKPVQLTIGNTGTADSPGLTLVAEVLLPDGAIVELARKPVDVLAGEDALELVNIPTTIAGQGDLRARLEDGEGEIVAELVPMPLAGAPPADSAAIARLGNEPVLIPVILLFAFALGFAAYMATGRYRNPAS